MLSRRWIYKAVTLATVCGLAPMLSFSARAGGASQFGPAGDATRIVPVVLASRLEPVAACSNAIYETAGFRSFLAANPALASLPPDAKRDLYVAKGISTTNDLIHQVRHEAHQINLLESDDDAADAPLAFDSAVAGIKVASLRLPEDHPSILAAGVINARMNILAGLPKDALEQLQTLKAKYAQGAGRGDPRLLPILASMADAYSATRDEEQAAVSDLQFLDLAAQRPDLARPLSQPTIRAEVRLAEYYEKQAHIAPLGERAHARDVAARYRQKSVDDRRRARFNIESLGSLAMGSLPGGAPMSVLGRNDELQAGNGSGVAAAIMSALDLVTAVTAEPVGKTTPFAAAGSPAARVVALSHCAAESGRAFAAWDARAGMTDFRTGLKQIDPKTAAFLMAEMLKKRDLPAALDELNSESDQANLDEFKGFVLVGVLGVYGEGDLGELADAIDAIVSEPVMAELGKADAKDDEAIAAKQVLMKRYKWLLGSGVLKARAVVTDLLRDSNPRVAADTRGLESWLHSNRDKLGEFFFDYAVAEHPGVQPTAAEKRDYIASITPNIVLAETVAAGLTTQAALSVNDVRGAGAAAARSVETFGQYQKLMGMSDAGDTLRRGIELARSTPDNPAYAALANSASEGLVGVGLNHGFAVARQVVGEEPDKDDDDRDSPDEKVLKTKLIAVAQDFISDVMFGMPDDEAQRRARGDRWAEVIDIIEKQQKADDGDTWQQDLLQDFAAEAPSESLPDTFQFVLKLSGLDEMLGRSVNVLFADFRAMRAGGHTHQAQVVTALLSDSVQIWSTRPKDIRVAWGRMLPDGAYQEAVGYLEEDHQTKAALAAANLWAEGKRNGTWNASRPDPHWEAHAYDSDRTAWGIDAALAAGEVERAGPGHGSAADADAVLTAVESANRSVVAADFGRRLRVGRQPADVQKAYQEWVVAAAAGQTQRNDDIVQAHGRLNLVKAIGSVSLASAGEAERAALMSREANAWRTYVAALARHGLTEGDDPISLQRLQASLDAKEVVLTALTVQGRIRLVTVNKITGLHVVSVGGNLEQKQLHELIARYRAGLAFTPSGSAAHYDREAGAALWALVGAPVIADLRAADRIIWVPPRGMDDLVLAALPTDHLLGDGGFLGLDRELMIAPSFNSLIAMRAAPRSTDVGVSATAVPLMAVGGISFEGRGVGAPGNLNLALKPTPFAASTLSGLNRDFPGTMLLSGPYATKSGLAALSGRSFNMTLFYTHGISAEQAALCGSGTPQALVLFQSPQSSCESALYTADDASRMTFRSRIILLAACSTEAQPDGELAPLDGLTRGFLLGGAQSVIGAQLPVQDAAASRVAAMMTKGLLQLHQGPSGALQAAMRAVEADPMMHAPAYWALFDVVGEGAPPRYPV